MNITQTVWPPAPSPVTSVSGRSAEAEGFEALAERLAEEMALCWRQGERPTADEYLTRYQELRETPGAAVKIICEEVCLRQDYGQEKEAAQVFARFPQWQSQLQAQLETYRRSRRGRGGPGFPATGEHWTDYELLAELGRGGRGRVFLAVEPRLANRPVVLKMTSIDGSEHLTLARLQHTHIVPLNVVQEDSDRNLRALCMPYFGGTSLDQLLEALKSKPSAQRTGQDLVDALDQIQAKYPVTVPARGPARQLLRNVSYEQAVCWIGACLADALQYAHERGLVHLDVKPANVLVAADGQPMLLDFHLAQQPVRGDGQQSGGFGGTPRYMSPEQRLWVASKRADRAKLPPVDSLSDIYSLGLVLYEALGGEVTHPAPPSFPALRWRNSHVSVGLADIIHKCLAKEPKDRYRNAAALAADLRRELSDLPLLGVRNRSLSERWRKWRRRKPQALTIAAMLLIMSVASLGVVSYTLTHFSQRRHDAEAAFQEGLAQLRGRAYAEAVRSFTRGRTLAEAIPGNAELTEALGNQLLLARRGEAAQHLHVLVDHIRLVYTDESRKATEFRKLEEHCQKVWEARRLLAKPGPAGLDADVERQIQSDLLDLAILWADLQGRLAASRGEEAYRGALQVLMEAEELLGASVILARERHAYAVKLGRTELADVAAQQATELAPRTAWEHFCLGRSLLGSGNCTEAMAQFDQALELKPEDFWACFYRGQCAYRLQRYEEAVQSFTTCLALMPHSAHCFHNRALARTALGETAKALRDYDRALQLDRTLAEAAFNRGILHYRNQNYSAAIHDLEQALQTGADAATVHYNLALVYLANADRPKAVASLRRALQQGGEQPEARQLLDRLLHNN